MTQTQRRVVVTGGAGAIGTAIAPLLDQRWDLLLTDFRRGCADSLDVTDGGACRAAFAGADAVVHLAAIPDPDASWEALLPANVVGAYHVAQAAADCGVRLDRGHHCGLGGRAPDRLLRRTATQR